MMDRHDRSDSANESRGSRAGAAPARHGSGLPAPRPAHTVVIAALPGHMLVTTMKNDGVDAVCHTPSPHSAGGRLKSGRAKNGTFRFSTEVPLNEPQETTVEVRGGMFPLKESAA